MTIVRASSPWIKMAATRLPKPRDLRDTVEDANHIKASGREPGDPLSQTHGSSMR